MNLFASSRIQALIRKDPSLAATIAQVQKAVVDDKLTVDEAVSGVLPALGAAMGRDQFDELVSALGAELGRVAFEPGAREAVQGLGAMSQAFSLGNEPAAPALVPTPQYVLDAQQVAERYLGKSMTDVMRGMTHTGTVPGLAPDGMMERYFQRGAEKFIHGLAVDQSNGDRVERLVLNDYSNVFADGDAAGAGSGRINRVQVRTEDHGMLEFTDSRHDGTVGQRGFSFTNGATGGYRREDVSAQGAVEKQTLLD